MVLKMEVKGAIRIFKKIFLGALRRMDCRRAFKENVRRLAVDGVDVGGRWAVAAETTEKNG